MTEETNPPAGDELKQYLERYEGLASEKQDISEQMKDVLAELKGRGYDPVVFKQLVARRKIERDEVENRDALLESYESALEAVE